jgi:ribosomal protein L37AE/L43A
MIDLKYLKNLHEKGFDIILTTIDKKPLSTWEERWSWEKIEEIYNLNKDKELNIAIKVGPFKNDLWLIAIDFDNPKTTYHIFSQLPSTVSRFGGLACPNCGDKHKRNEKGYFVCEKCREKYTKDKALRTLAFLYFVKEETLRELGLDSNKKFGDVEILVKNHLITIPPSKHVDGVEYEWINEPRFYSEDLGIKELDKETLAWLINELQKFAPKPTIEIKTFEEKRSEKLSEGEFINRVVNLIIPYYVVGFRDFIVFSLSGALMKEGISKDITLKIVETIANKTNDEERNQRIAVVEWLYEKNIKAKILKDEQYLRFLKCECGSDGTIEKIDDERYRCKNCKKEYSIKRLANLIKIVGYNQLQETIAQVIKSKNPAKSEKGVENEVIGFIINLKTLIKAFKGLKTKKEELSIIESETLENILKYFYLKDDSILTWKIFSRWFAKAKYSPSTCFNILEKIKTEKEDERNYKELLSVMIAQYLKEGYELEKVIEELKENDVFIEVGIDEDDEEFIEAIKNLAKEEDGKTCTLSYLIEKVGKEEKDALYWIYKLEQIFGVSSPFELDPFFAERKRGKNVFANIPTKGTIAILIIDDRQKTTEYDYDIYDCAFLTIEVYKDVDTNLLKYKVRIIEPNGEIEVFSGFEEDIKNEMRRFSKNRNLYSDAFNALINASKNKKKAKIANSPLIEGFTVYNGKLFWSREVEGKVEYDVDKLKIALKKLLELREWYKNLKEFWAIVKLALISPFTYAFKKIGKRPIGNPLIFGPTAVGKSTLVNLLKFVWDIPDREFYLTPDMTAPRLAEKLRKTTYGMGANEAEKIFEDKGLMGIIRNSWDSLYSRERFYEGRLIQYPALSLIWWTTRANPRIYLRDDDLRRMIIFDLSGYEPFDEEKQREFELKFGNRGEFLQEYLRYIGPFVYKFMLENWERVKEYDLYTQWQSLGSEIIEYLFKIANIEIPNEELDAIRKEYIQPKLRELREERRDQIILIIKSKINEAIRPKLKPDEFVLKDVYGNATGEMNEKERWEHMLKLYDKIVDSHEIIVDSVEREIYLTNAFLKTLEERGIILSSLEELANILKESPQDTKVLYERKTNRRKNLKGNKVVTIKFDLILPEENQSNEETQPQIST